MKNEVNWRIEKIKYTKLSLYNIPSIGSELFYKIAHTIRDGHMAKCTLKEILGNKLIVYFGDNPNHTMSPAKVSHFYIKTLNPLTK